MGYYTADRTLDEGALRRFLSLTLPAYMIPSALVKIDAIPLNVSGKYDRKALLKPARAEGVSRIETPEEQVLADCLAELFHTERLDFEQTFSEAGGDSLGAIQLLSALIEKQYTIDVVDIINPAHSLRDIARLLVPCTASIT